MPHLLPVALFDLDNTLVDRASAFRRWAIAFCARHGLEGSAVDWLCELDNDGFAARQEVFGSARDRYLPSHSIEALIKEYRREYPSFYSPDPKVGASLSKLRRAGWRIGVVTNGPASQWDKLSRSGLRSYVDVCTVSEEAGVAKPDPRIFFKAIRECVGSARSSVWMVGDTADTDIDGGRRSGCRTVWLRRGRTWGIATYTPDFIVQSVTDAVEVMLAMSVRLDS